MKAIAYNQYEYKRQNKEKNNKMLRTKYTIKIEIFYLGIKKPDRLTTREKEVGS